MKALLALVLVGAAQAQITQQEPVYIQSGKENFLTGTIPATNYDGSTNMATHCNGFLFEGSGTTGTGYTIPDTPLQATEPRCKINATGKLKVGTMTWQACVTDSQSPTFGGVCNTNPLIFTVVQGTGSEPTPLAPPSNPKVQL